MDICSFFIDPFIHEDCTIAGIQYISEYACNIVSYLSMKNNTMPPIHCLSFITFFSIPGYWAIDITINTRDNLHLVKS